MRRAAAVTAAALAALAALSAAGSPAPPDSPLARTNPWLSACDLHQYQYQGQGQGHVQSPPGKHPCSWGRGDQREAEAAAFTMPHCRERTLLSALDSTGRQILRDGGISCHRLVDDLMAVDALAWRTSRDLDSVLQRYDCQQTFSVIHKCEDCKESYRRWVCGSLLPYFILEDHLHLKRRRAETDPDPDTEGSHGRPNERAPRSSEPPATHHRHRRTLNSYELYASNNKNTKLKRTVAASDYDLLIGSSDVDAAEYKAASYVYSNDSYLYNNFGEKDGAVRYNGSGGMQDRRPLDNRLGRRRREPDTIIRNTIRVKPCIKQCQEVEKVCPYFLPGDRAPSYPTQYAGEPTFLCLDPNIDETGEQLLKSNYGDPSCCYDYCDDKPGGFCYNCTEGSEEVERTKKQPTAGECAPTVSTPPSTCSNLGSSSSKSSAVVPLHIDIVLLVSILNIVYNNIVYWDARQDASTAWTILEAVFNYCYNKYTTILPCTRL